MATLAQIDAKVNAAVAASTAGDYQTAIVRLTEASALIISVPDREFDGQKVSFPVRDQQIKDLLTQYKSLAASQPRGNGGFKNFPIVRAYRES
jgi:hypothetical protein